jgi:hypothetical protein
MNRAVKKELHNRGLYNNHTHNPRKKALLEGPTFEPSLSVQEALDNTKNIIVTSLRRYGLPIET